MLTDRMRSWRSLFVGLVGLLFAASGWAQAPDPDINDDGIVDIFDVSLVGSCFGLDPQTTPQCKVADTGRQRREDDGSASVCSSKDGDLPVAPA